MKTGPHWRKLSEKIIATYFFWDTRGRCRYSISSITNIEAVLVKLCQKVTVVRDFFRHDVAETIIDTPLSRGVQVGRPLYNYTPANSQCCLSRYQLSLLHTANWRWQQSVVRVCGVRISMYFLCIWLLEKSGMIDAAFLDTIVSKNNGWAYYMLVSCLSWRTIWFLFIQF